jgi:hypothetical protein
MNKQKNLYRFKPLKRRLRGLGFVLDDYATYVDREEVSFKYPYVYFGMMLCYVGFIFVDKYHSSLFLSPF